MPILPGGTAWRHKRKLMRARPSFECTELLSGIHRLAEMPMSINGLAPDPVLRYKGGDANVTNWPAWTYGETLTLQAGTAPSYNQGSPLLGAIDDSVLKKTSGGDYAAGNTTFGNISLEDMVIEAVLLFPAGNANIVNKRGGGAYWELMPHVSGVFIFGITDGANSASASSSAVTPGLVHVIAVCDRSIASAAGMRLYVQGANSGAGANPSSVGSLSNSDALHVLAYGGNDAEIQCMFISAYAAADWLDLSSTTEVDALAAARFAALTSSRPLISWGGATSPSAKGSTSATYQRKATSGVTRLWSVGAGFPRFERVLDANGVEFVGSLVEAGSDYLSTKNRDVNVWTTKTNVTTPSTSVACIDGTTRTTNHIQETTDTGEHEVRINVSIGAAGHKVYHARLQPVGARDWVKLWFFDGAEYSCYFDLVNRVVGASGTHIDADIDDEGDGWLHCWFSFDALSGGSGPIGITMAETDGDIDFTGSTSDGVYMDFVGVEAGDYPTSPVVTDTAATARAADVLRYSIVEGADIGAGQGAVRFRFLAPSFTPGRSHYLWSISDGGAAADMIGIYLDTSGYLNVESAASGGSAGAVQIATNFCDNYIHEVLCSWRAGRLDLYCDGIPGTPDTSVTVPDDLDTLDVGTDESQANHAGPVLVADWKMYQKYLSGWSR